MLDWLIDTRVRVRANFVTCGRNYYDNLGKAKNRVERLMAYYEGTKEDKKRYLRNGCTTYRFYKEINCQGDGHLSENICSDEIEETAYIEFNCWKSTFKRLKLNFDCELFDMKIVGPEVL